MSFNPKKPFIHLNAHSTYSLLDGMMPIKKLAAWAHDNNMPALGVTDTNNMFGAIDMSFAFKAAGIQPIFGTQLGVRRPDQEGFLKDAGRLTFHVQNEEGWRNICVLISKAYIDKDPAELANISLDMLKAHAGGLICTTGGAQISPLTGLIEGEQFDKAESFLKDLHGIFDDRLYVELQRHGLAREELMERHLSEWAYKHGIPLVATNDSRFFKEEHVDPYEVMLSIGSGSVMSDPERPRTTPHHRMKSAEEMCKLFEDVPEATQQTSVIAQRCAYWMPVGTYYMPAWPRKDDDPSVEDIMREESEKGFRFRMDEYVLPELETQEEKDEAEKFYRERLEFEIKTINHMGYPGYFLITSDFIRWSKANDIPVGPGRGSGAGSLVAYCLDITDVDPIRWDLYFERFLNPERVSLPDFDVDFCPEGREDVISYVRDKYGAENVSQIITFGTLKARACIRDVGRVLEMGFGTVSGIAGFIPEGPASIPIDQALLEEEKLRDLYDTDEDVKLLLDMAMDLEGAYRHASTHAAGIHIADRPIHAIAPLFKDPRAEMQVTAFDWGKAEEAGLVKFDFLGLKTLSVVNYAIKDIKRIHNVDIDPLKIPFDDDPTFKLLQDGYTTGVFQVESRGMTEYLKKIYPDKFQYLSDIIALYRPGPLASGMVEDFIECRHGRQEAVYPHPALEPVLKETFGVPVYQEQIMKMAQVMAGYTLGGADMLRRAMGKKKPEEMAKQKAIFLKGCKDVHNVDEKHASEIFALMEGFAAYGFNKAHTIAYALVSWQTAYLKANYPLEFMAASMTLDRGNSEKILKFKAELQRMDVTLQPPCVNHSEVFFTVAAQAGAKDSNGKEHKNGAIRFALGAIKGVGDEAMSALVEERNANGPYLDIYDFVERQDPGFCNRRIVEALAKSGAFDEIHPNRAEVVANVSVLLGLMQSTFEQKNSDQIGLFGLGGEEEEAPTLSRPDLTFANQWDKFEKLKQELSSLGFYLSSHPLEAYADVLRDVDGLVEINTLEDRATEGGVIVKVAGVIAAKRIRKTKTGKRMAILHLSDRSGQDEIAVFPESYEAYADLIDASVPLLAHLSVSLDEDRLRVSVERLENLEDVAQGPSEIELVLRDVDAAKVLKEYMEPLTSGRTKPLLKVQIPGRGQVHLKLKKGLKVTKPFLAKAETLTQ